MATINRTKQQNILSAALELFAEQGFHNAPMARVASNAGVGVGSIYRYFSDKTGLIEALHTQVDETMQSAIALGIDSRLSTQEQFIQLITNLIHFLHENPQEFLFLEQYYHSPFGIDKKRDNRLLQSTRERKSHFMALLFSPDNLAIKSVPIQVLFALAFGPALFLVRDAIAGLVTLDETLISQVAAGSWDAVRSGQSNL